MNRALQDLHWAITSPSLLVDDPPLSGELRMAIESFDPSSIDQTALAAFLSAAPSRRVGRYFERLILYWLSHVCGFRIVAHGYQVIDNGRTIGELDFLFRDTAGQLHHWETAVKFYLQAPIRQSHGDRLLGPNPADSFEKKRTRLYQHQLPLSRRVFDEPVCRHAFVKGRIFYPSHPNPERHFDSRPSGLSSAHLRGIWIRAAQLDWFQCQPASNRYKLLVKPHWLAPERVPASSADCLTAAAMRRLLDEHFEQHSQARLCSVLRPQGEHYEENERLFIVNNDWPDRSAGSNQAKQEH